MIITAKYLGPTNTKGARIKVSAQGLKPRTYPWMHWNSQCMNYQEAIRDYIRSHELNPSDNPFVFHDTAGGALAVRSSWVLPASELEPYSL